MAAPLPFTRPVVVHEWATIPGGSENVVEAILSDVLPGAPLYVSVFTPENYAGSPISRARPSFLQKLPGAQQHYPKLLPLMDAAYRRFDLSNADLVVSSSHACAKNVRVPAGVPHVCYCHTPMRYAWDPGFLEGERLGTVGKAVFKVFLPKLRRDDLRGARSVTRFVANSSFVAERIRTTYGRDATVVHPPVAVERFLDRPRRVAPDDDAPYLFFGRIVPYKKADVAAAACARLGRKLRIAGTGRDLDRVRAVAGPEVELLGRVADHEVAELFATSRALLFPGVEDFGIVPVEAQAAGLPVVGRNLGGLRDSVVDGETGVLYDGEDAAAMAAGIERFEGLELDEARIRAHAANFSGERFAERFAAVLRSAV